MKIALTIISVLLIALFIVIVVVPGRDLSQSQPPESANHIYASWDTMEFDKCVSAWLIVRFVDADAKFVFYSKDTEITKGIVFDVPGADWSRKHRKCTSDCILESLDLEDSALEKIVEIAHQAELNFWQLDRWPQARKCFDEVRQITDETASPSECFERTKGYFDKLYDDFKMEKKQ